MFLWIFVFIMSVDVFGKEYMVQIKEDCLEDVKQQSEGLHWKYKRKIVSNIYLFEAEHREDSDTIQNFRKAFEGKVLEVESRECSKLRFVPWLSDSPAPPDFKQWLLTTRTKPKMGMTWPYYGMDIQEAWSMGLTGQGIKVAIVDSGVELNHTDLEKNIDRELSQSFAEDGSRNGNAKRLHFYPETDVYTSHGTKAAGLVAAEFGNGICSAGVAFNASIISLKVFRCDETSCITPVGVIFPDDHITQALEYRRNEIDIYSCSFGLANMFATSTSHIKTVLKEGIAEGRNGKGSIYVFSAGNIGNVYDCNTVAYTNSIYTITIASVGKGGTKPSYSIPCSSVLAAAYGEYSTYNGTKYLQNPQPIHNKYRLYSPSAMTAAYRRVKEDGLPVLKAARMYRVPETTLRDRVLLKIDPDTCVMGKIPMFNQFQEAKIVEHFKKMASLGYGYTQQECVNVASTYAVQHGIRTKEQPLTMSWMRGFMKRWPEIRLTKPRALEFARAKMAKESTVHEYFDNLEQCLRKHDIIDKPHLIYNVDEKGVSIDHKPPHVISSVDFKPQAVTSGKGQTVTILGCGSASGTAVPPYFIFAGQRMNSDLLKGKTPGADGAMSDSGWSNLDVFSRYLTEHFIKFIPGRDSHPLILLLDGHRSHVSLTLAEWAIKNNIILFILPAHTSHLCQPLDVSCYGPFQKMYHAQCHKLIRETSAAITRYNICEISCKVYARALNATNLQNGFMRTGIYPLDRNAVPKTSLIPGEVFELEQPDVNICSQNTESTVEGGVLVEDHTDFFDDIVKNLKSAKQASSSKKPRNTVSKHVSGKELTSESVMKAVSDHIESQKKPKSKTQKSKKPTNKSKKSSRSTLQNVRPVAGPSCVNLVYSDTEVESDVEIDPAKLCCVCKKFQPTELAQCVSLTFTKWAQCDGKKNGQPCMHWCHLIYCSEVRFIRRGDIFLCPHCIAEE